MLNKMELRYFKKHESIDVNFEQGLNGIVGANYKGKSTLLLGVMYCLGGARMVPGNRIATRGTNTGFRTALWFTIQGKGVFHVERTKTKANLWSLNADGDETLVASGTSPVNTAISELLGMPLRRFAQIKFAKQKAADALLKYSSTELFQIVTELTGLGRIVEVLGMLETDLKVQRGIVEVLPVIDVAPKQTSVLELINELTGLQCTRDGWSNQMTEVGGRLTEARQLEANKSAQAFSLFKAKQSMDTAANALGIAETRHGNAQAALDDLITKTSAFSYEGAGVDTALELMEAHRNQWQAAAKTYHTLSGEVTSLTREVAGLDARETELAVARDATKAALEATPSPDITDLPKAKDLVEDLRTRKVQAEHDLAHATTAQNGGVCRGCQRPFDNFDPVVAAAKVVEAEQAVAAVKKELETAKNAALDLEQAIDARKAALTKADRAELALHEFLKHAEEVRTNLTSKQATLESTPSADKVSQQAEEVLVKISELRDLKRAEQRASEEAVHAKDAFESALVATQSATKAYQEALASAETDSEKDLAAELETLRTKTIPALESELAEATREHKVYSEEHASLNTRVRLLEQEIATGLANNTKAQAAQDCVVRMESLQGMLRTNRDRYSRQVWDVFMASASMFASTVTGGAIESLARSESGAFTFMEDGFEMSLEEGSGAQLAIIGVAVQMALAEAAQCPLDILLMDEPTADMDAEHALAFSTLLAGSGKQTVIVTHREMDSAVFDNTITL